MNSTIYDYCLLLTVGLHRGLLIVI